MKPWFIWNNKNSDSMGLWVSKLPKISRAPERYEQVTIPGRAGALTLLEGEDVYDSYVKEITVQTVNTNPRLQEILAWLRGSGDLVVCTEINRVYRGRIVAAVEFERIGNSLLQARIPILVEPLKRSRYPEANDRITITAASANLRNPGDVASKPVVSITGSGALTITIGGTAMAFTGVSGTIVVDCDAEMVTQGGALWTGSYSGEFWRIPAGASTFAKTGTGTLTSAVIDPAWRWV